MQFLQSEWGGGDAHRASFTFIGHIPAYLGASDTIISNGELAE